MQILTQARRFSDAKPWSFWATVGVASVSLFGMVAAFGTAPSTAEIAPILHPVVEELALPTTEPVESATDIFVREQRIQRGDTVTALLSGLGADGNEALAYLRSEPKADLIFRQMSPGKTVTAKVRRDGTLMALTFPLNGDKDLALVIERDAADQYRISEQPLALETQVLMGSAEITYSLFGATDAAGIPDSVATQLADIFGGDIDFHRDIRKGDRFSVIYESINHLGKPVRTGRILAAEFINDGNTYRAVWFEDSSGKGGYYTADGKNLRKSFLRSPLEFSRVTSGFSSARFHPVLKEMRAHKGIDFGAPIGTRVRATGDGVVEFAGRKGGYGNMIMLRHQGRYETVYGHLSRFAKGLHAGTRVSQGDVIGYVGMTGLATGPHLHYEFRVAGVQRNPLAMVLPGAPPLAASQMGQFREKTQGIVARLEDIRGANLALLD